MLLKKEMLSPKMYDFYKELGEKVTEDINQFIGIIRKMNFEYQNDNASIVRLIDNGKEAKGIVPINISDIYKNIKYRAYTLNGFDAIAIELYFDTDNTDFEKVYDKSGGFIKLSYIINGNVIVTEIKNGSNTNLSNEELLSPKMIEIYKQLSKKIANDMNKYDELRKLNINYKISPNSNIHYTGDDIEEQGIIEIPDLGQYAKYKAYTCYGSKGFTFDLEFTNNKEELGKENKKLTGKINFDYLDGDVSIWEIDDELSLQDENEDSSNFQKVFK